MNLFYNLDDVLRLKILNKKSISIFKILLTITGNTTTTTPGPVAKMIYKEKNEAKTKVDDNVAWMQFGIRQAFNDLFYALKKKFYWQ